MIDLFIVLAFVVYAVGSGLRSRAQAGRSLDEYFLAGRTLRGWQAGTSMAATQFAADTPLLVTGLIATAGVFAVWRLWIYGLAFLLMAFVFSALWRRAGVLTDAELTRIRYSGRGVMPLRILKAVYYGTVINCVVLAMVLVAAVRIAEVFLPWHEWLPAGVWGGVADLVARTGLDISSGVTGIDPLTATTDNLISILVIVAFTALYSMTGGLRAVVATDVAQFALAMIGTAIYAWVAVAEAGGLLELPERLADAYGAARAAGMTSFWPPAGDALAPFLVIVGLQWLFQMNSDGTGYLAQRSMACRSTQDARTAGVVFAWLQIFLRSLFWIAIAVALLLIYPIAPGEPALEGFAAAREILFVVGIDELLPAGARGLVLTGLLAALASTVDTHLNWGASYWSNDVYRGLIAERWMKRSPGRRELVVVARLSNLLILSIALGVMANLGSIQTAWFISLLFGAGTGSVLVLRWLWERINLWSEFAAIAVSLVIAPVLLVTTDDEWLRLGVMAMVSTAAAVGVTFFTPATAAPTLAGFYRRVAPAGFWGRTARQLGDDPAESRARLGHGLRMTAATCASLFLLLVGVGRLLFERDVAGLAVASALIVSGTALVPYWWRRGVRAPADVLPSVARDAGD